MRFVGERLNLGPSCIVYNGNVTASGVPLAACVYVVNGKPAIEHVMERQEVSTDEKSGIVNDANR